MAGNVKIDIRDLEEILRLKLRDYLYGIGEDVIAEARRNLYERDNIVTGRLFASGYVEDKSKGDKIEIEFGFDCPYAGYLEFGTMPRMKLPPIDELKKWAKLKFGLGEEEAKKIAWAVAHHIRDFGTQPRAYFRRALFRILEREG